MQEQKNIQQQTALPANSIKVWVVDDDHNFCQYLCSILGNQPKYDVIGVSYSLTQAYEDIKVSMPDMVTIDLSLPDGSGVELVKWLEKHMPDVIKIIVSFWGQEDLVYEAITNGANGYLQKDHLLTMEISKAITTLESGGTPISPKLAKYFLQHFKDKKEQIQEPKAKSSELESDGKENDNEALLAMHLSEREIEVLELLTQGLSYNEISDKLNVSYHTVSSHIKNIYKKLNVTSKVEAILAAQQNAWFGS